METLVPDQIEGKKVDLSHSESFASKIDAARCFHLAHERLLNPNGWHALTGMFSAEFNLMDRVGKEVLRAVQISDHIRVDIPGPGPSSGGGYDWVKVEEIEDESNTDAETERVGMTLMPSKDPTRNNHNIAHFFTAHASSTFVIERKGTIVTSFYYGRNEFPNVKTDKTIDNIRNAIVASGAMASLSEAQWMTLIKAFLSQD